MDIKNKQMKKIGLIVVFVLVIIVFIAVLIPHMKTNKIQKQLLLGEKYLQELDYENAIVAFEKAIMIDPKNEEAYLCLADVYIAMENFDKAIEVLESFEDESQIIEDKIKYIMILIEREMETNISVDTLMIEEVESEVEDDGEWRDTYISFLSALSNQSDFTGDFFYVDNDSIPEIIIDTYWDHQTLYKYNNGNVVEVIEYGADGLGGLFVCEKESVIMGCWGDEWEVINAFFKMNKDGSTEHITTTVAESEDGMYFSIWTIDDMMVNENEYNNKLDEIVNIYGEFSGGFELSYSIAELIDILKNGDTIPEGQHDIYELYNGQSGTDSEEENSRKVYEAYDGVISNARNNLFHDGTPNDFYIDGEISYAYEDIDNDNIDELIISNFATSTVGCASYIYNYDMATNSVFLLYEGSLDINIYNNGMIQDKAYHNHSLGILWPFSVYRFYPSGESEYVTYVESWDVEYGEEYNGESFPYNIDADGNGVVYYLFNEYVDDNEFNNWYNENFNNDSLIQLNYIYM